MKIMLEPGAIVPPVKEGPQWECRARPLGMLIKELKLASQIEIGLLKKKK